MTQTNDSSSQGATPHSDVPVKASETMSNATEPANQAISEKAAERDLDKTPTTPTQSTKPAGPTSTPEPPQPAQSTRSRVRRVGRIGRAIGWTLFGTSVVLVGGVTTLVVSPALQHQLIYWGASYVEGLHLASLDGSLLAPTVQGFTYEAPGVKVTVGRLGWGIDLRNLTEKTVNLTRLFANDITVEIDTQALPKTEEATSEPLGRIRLPVAIRLQKASLENLKVVVDGMELSLGQLRTAAAWQGEELVIDSLTLTHAAVTLASSNVAPATPGNGKSDTTTTDVKDHPARTDKDGATLAHAEAPQTQTALNANARAQAGVTAFREQINTLKRTLGFPLMTASDLPQGPLLPFDLTVKSAHVRDVSVATPAERAVLQKAVTESGNGATSAGDVKTPKERVTTKHSSTAKAQNPSAQNASASTVTLLSIPAVRELTLIASVTEKAVAVPHVAVQLDDLTTVLGSANVAFTDQAPVTVSLWAKPGSRLPALLTQPIDPLTGLSSVRVDLTGAILGTLSAAVELSARESATLTATLSPATAGLPFSLKLNAAKVGAESALPQLTDLELTAQGRFAPMTGVMPLAGSTHSATAKAKASTTTKGRTPISTTSAQRGSEKKVENTEGWSVKLKGQLIPPTGEGLPVLQPMRVALSANGTLERIALTDTGLQNRDGTAVLEGHVDWSQALKGDVRLALVGFDLGVLSPNVPVKLAGEAALDLSSRTDDVLATWQATLSKAAFKGTLARLPIEKSPASEKGAKKKAEAKNKSESTLNRTAKAVQGTKRAVATTTTRRPGERLLTQPVIVNATAKADALGDWQASVNEIRWAQNTISGEGAGTFGPKGLSTDATLTLSLEALSDFAPEVSGALRGTLGVKGHFDGPTPNPVITSDLRGDGIAVRNTDGANALQVGDVRMVGTFGGAPFNSTTQSSTLAPLILTISNLVVGEVTDEDETQPMRFESISTTLTGNLASHQLTATVKGGPAPATLSITGGLARDFSRWQGSIDRITVETPLGKAESDAATLNIALNNATATLGAHCWQLPAGVTKGTPTNRVCVAEPATLGTQGQAHLSVERFDLASLAPLLGPDLRLKGLFTGGASARWDLNQTGVLPQVTLDLQNQGVTVTRETDNGSVVIPFDAITLQAKTTAKDAQVALMVAPQKNGRLTANVTVADVARDRRLRGRITLEKVTLDALNELFSSGEVAKGHLEADVGLAGTLAHPELDGFIKLTEADIQDGLVPLDIQPSDMTVHFTGSHSTLDGMLRTSDGEVEMTGSADWSDLTDPKATVRLRTLRDGREETLGLTVPPYAKLNMAADVTASADNKGLNINGEVVIPQGTITIEKLPESAIQPSDDLVMLKRDLTPVKPKSAGLPIHSNLKITVGPKVRVDAFDLKAGLTGSLVMTQGPNGLGLSGNINLRRGRFYAYGQALQITKGEILFAGPIDNPILNLEAIRDPNATEDGVTAGLRVTGSAIKPKVTIYSTPAMSQEAALSYLLRGQGLGSSGSDGQAVATALLGMGLSQTSSIVSSIGNAFGISDLSVGSEGVGDKTKVVVSGHLLPRLQLKYGVGVFDSLATFTLRYRLFPRLYLQGIWDEAQTLDLLYRWEFN